MSIKSRLMKKLARKQNDEQKDKQKDDTLIPPGSLEPCLGPPPNYPKAVTDFQDENKTKIENGESLPEEPKELTPIEERNAWLAHV